MKALTIRQPWAAFIGFGWKRIENRDWFPPASLIGERIAIHAGASRGLSHHELIDVLHAVGREHYRDSRERLAMPWTLGQWDRVFEAQRGRVVATAVLSRVHTGLKTIAPDQRVWWVGEVGLQLDALETVNGPEVKGMLKFWELPANYFSADEKPTGASTGHLDWRTLRFTNPSN